MNKFDVKKAEALTINGYYYEGLAFLMEYKGCQFVVTCPNKESLAQVFTQIHGGVIDMSKACATTVTAPQNISVTEMKTVPDMLKERQEKANEPQPPNGLYWFYLEGTRSCILEYDDCTFNGNDFELLGPAMQQTVTECKLLLRGLGWKRGDIESVKISDTEPMPF